jgi:hypothetical protein
LKQKINSSSLYIYKKKDKILKKFSFWNFLKTNALEKLVEQNFSKTLFDALESAKNTFFCDVTKVENFDKKCLP